MKPKRKITKAEFDALPEDWKENYVAEGDLYVLTIEGMHHAERLAEHKKTNDDLKKLIRESETRFNGIDPERYRAMEQTINDFENGKGEKVQDLVNKKIAEQKASSDRLLGEERAKTAKAEETSKKRFDKLSTKAVRSFVFENAAKHGVTKTALTDAFNRASSVWRYDEEQDKVLPYRGEELWTENGYDAITPDKYFGEVMFNEAPHLYDANSGTGSQGSKKTNGSSARTIKKSDALGLMKHQKEIADGTMTVVDG